MHYDGLPSSGDRSRIPRFKAPEPAMKVGGVERGARRAMANILERKWFLLLLGVVAGLGLGVLYAWQINPVQWVDGEPHQLRVDLREDYMRMLLDSYTVNRDSDLATRRYQSLGEFAQQALLDVAEDPGEVSPTSIQGLRALVEIGTGVTPEPGTPSEPGTTPRPTEEASGPLPSLTRYTLPVGGFDLVLAGLAG